MPVSAPVPAAFSTTTGSSRLVVVPSPSTPLALSPQQRAVASFIRAHVCGSPRAIWVMPVSGPVPAGFLTTTGSSRLVVVPSPSFPLPLLPQQRAVPSLIRAHEKTAAAVTLVTAVSGPVPVGFL